MSGNMETELRDRVVAAMNEKTTLAICGGQSKAFLGREIIGEDISISEHSGIVDYQPTELVLTARAGTNIAEINATLTDKGQMLGFDPPLFTQSTTLGGAIAAGLSGPSRPFVGSVQDFILGIKLLSGKGEILNFGGRVIKNVAGFDVSRLMAGSMGCLGVILEVSLKVLPRHETTITLEFKHPDSREGIDFMNEAAGRPLPITAAAWIDGKTYIRLSGTNGGVTAARSELEGKDSDNKIWQSIRDQTHGFFDNDQLQIKSVVPGATLPFCTETNQLIDWSGGCRWICTEQWDNEFGNGTRAAGGHCTLFRNGDRSEEVFALPDPAIMQLHQKLKATFDPEGIFNPGRMYSEL